MGLWATLIDVLRGPGSAERKALDRRAGQCLDSGRERATEIVEKNYKALMSHAAGDEGFAKYVAENNKLFFSIETQFLWGFFHSHVQNFDLPTDAFVRIKLHLIDWLMHRWNMELEAARENASLADQLYNEADTVFLGNAELGMQAYKSKADHYFLLILESIRDPENFNPEKILSYRHSQ